MALSLALLTNGVVTDVIKNAYGRPRPDFLSRCFTPTGASENHDPLFTKANGDNLWLTLPSRFKLNYGDRERVLTTGMVHFWTSVLGCTTSFD